MQGAMGSQARHGWRPLPLRTTTSNMRVSRKSRAKPTQPDDDEEQSAADEGQSAEVLEFVTAIDEFKRKNQKPFPSWSEVLGVLRSLGWRRERKSA